MCITLQENNEHHGLWKKEWHTLMICHSTWANSIPNCPWFMYSWMVKYYFFYWVKEYLKSLPLSPVLTVTLYLVELKHFILFYFIQCIEATRQEHVLIFHYLLRVKTSYKSMMTGQAQKETYIKNIKKRRRKKKSKSSDSCSVIQFMNILKEKKKKTYLPSSSLILIYM